jgi:transcriptional regulator with XRE-family HTH domain
MPKLRTLTSGASPRHHFGAEVRRAREAAGMSQAELGDLVPCDKATVSRIEVGLLVPDRHFAAVCATALSNEWFIRFWDDSQEWGTAIFPPSLSEFTAYEAEATTLWLCEHSLIPGLLQTQSYALATLERHPDTPPEQAAERAAARIARQAVLARDRPPRVWVLIDEQALYREVASAAVMADQMRHLGKVARLPHVIVQLLPKKGANVGLSGAFAVAETHEATVAYLNHQADSTTTDSPATIALVCGRFDWLRTEAYRGSESLAMIDEAERIWASSVQSTPGASPLTAIPAVTALRPPAPTGSSRSGTPPTGAA